MFYNLKVWQINSNFTKLKSATLTFGPKSGEEDITVKVGDKLGSGKVGAIHAGGPSIQYVEGCA